MSRSPGVSNNGLLGRWARTAVRRRWWVLLASISVVVIVVVLWQAFGGEFATDFAIPGTESQMAADLLKERFPQQAGDSATLVFKAAGDVTSQDIRPQIEAVLKEAGQLPGVSMVGSPYGAGGGGAVSRDRHIAFATLQFSAPARSVPRSDVDALFTLADKAESNGLQVEAGGRVVQSSERQPPGSSEAIGLVAAILVLLVAFGSAVAMGLPLVTALAGLGASFALIGLLANLLDLPSATTSFASMIGIGVGIDYALFVVTRFREGLRSGLSVEESVARSLSTAGQSVAFAGGVVVISMLALVVLGIPIASSLGVAIAVVVGLAVLAALALLPALLSIVGRRIDRWAIPFVRPTADAGNSTSIWYRLSILIQRRPIAWTLGALAILALLATPVLSMRLGSADAGNGSEFLHSRRAYDLLAEGFGPGFNGPLAVVLDLKDVEDASQRIEEMRTALEASPGIAQVSPPRFNQAGDTAIVTVIPQAAPQDAATQQLVHELRGQVLSSHEPTTGVRAYVAGPTAAFIDIGDRITSRMPVFFAVVIGFSFLLLVAVFRSLVVPLTAAVMNLLSMGASYGVVVAVFQWGWLSGLIGVRQGPIESFLPMMLFAILFGLSMDYEVFLISRMREAYVRTRDNRESVARGLAVTARVITAAASVMVVVFLSFVLGSDRIVKEFGLGLATAILVDATVVRLVLVPAVMQLLGNANWWLPAPLGRVLPRLAQETVDPEGISMIAKESEK